MIKYKTETKYGIRIFFDPGGNNYNYKSINQKEMSALSIIQVKTMLEETRPSFEDMNLNKLDFAKEMEFAIQIFQNSDYLRQMDVSTVKNALVNVTLTGLSLNPVLKYAYLVPRKGKCCVDPSYMGLIKIITDTGSVKSIRAGIVYEKEEFDIEMGTNGFVKHKIFRGTGERGRKLGAYSIAVLNDGSFHVEWMYWDEIMKIKARSESVKKGKSSPWDSDEDEMSRKTVVKRHWKYVPKSERAILAANVINMDDDNNGIDFEEERREADAAKQKEGSFKTEPLFASVEEIAKVNELVNNFILPDRIFGGKTVKANFITKINDEFAKGDYPKEKVEAVIKALEYEIHWFTTNPASPTEPVEATIQGEMPQAVGQDHTDKDPDF